MANNMNICKNCSKEYVQCKPCEETYSKVYFAWRTKYCSPKCMAESMSIILESGEPMRIEYNKKTYTIKEYDLDKDLFITSNEMKLKAIDITAFMITSEEFVKTLNHTPKVSKAKVLKEQVAEEVVD